MIAGYHLIWTAYLETVEDMERTIEYIEQNLVKIGQPVQRWPFVAPYDGWLPAQVRVVRKLAKPQAKT